MLEQFTPQQLESIIQNIYKLPMHEQAETLEMLEELKDRHEAKAAQTSLLAFAHRMAPVLQIETEPKVFMVGPHHRKLAALMDSVARGEKKRILISVAPRMGKSLLSSYLLPAWYMGKFPNRRIIMASNTSDMASGFGRKVRDLINTVEYQNVFPNVNLKADSKAAGQWATNKGGEYYACITLETTVRSAGQKTAADRIQIGDWIESGQGRVQVLEVFHTHHRSTVVINNLHCSAKHPVFIFGRGWVDAAEVCVNNILHVESIFDILQAFLGKSYVRIMEHPAISALVQYKISLYESAKREVARLWGTWNIAVSSVANICKLCLRYGAPTNTRTYDRSHQQYGTVQSGELPLGYPCRASEQQTKYCDVIYSGYAGTTSTSSATMWSGTGDNSTPYEAARDVWGRSANSPQTAKEKLETASRAVKHGWIRDTAVWFLGRSSASSKPLEPASRAKSFMACVGETTQVIQGLLLGIRRVTKISIEHHEPRPFINFHVTGANTFTASGILTHNCGVGSALAGRGCDLAVIDDPFSEQAAISGNTDIFDDAWTWFQSGPLQRLSPTGAVIVIHCIAEGERVLMANGRWVPIEQVRVGDRVASKEGKNPTGAEVTAAELQGEDDILEVTSRSCTLRVNKRHPFLVVKGGLKKSPKNAADCAQAKQWITEWVQAGDLRPGDTVVTIKQLETGRGHRPKRNATQGATQDDYWLFGFMLGDGWLVRSRTRGVVGFAIAKSVYPELNARVLAAVKTCFGVDMKDTSYGYWRVDSASLGSRLAALGLLHGAKNKRVPDWAFQLRSCDKRAFILGMCEADGCLREAKRGNPVYTIGINNYEMLDDFRLLARTCGVKTTKIYTEHFTAQPPHSSAPIQGTTHRARFTFSHGRIEGRARYKYQTSGSGTQHFRFEDIESITSVGRARVYDLTVAGTENFIAEGFVVHNTRWNKMDLIGRLIDQMTKNPDTEQWEIVEFPAVMNEGMENEKSLWPERWPLEILLQKKAVMAPYLWNAQYQQNPTGEAGALIKREWWKDWDKEDPPKCEYLIMSLDAAQESNNRSDFNAWQVWGVFFMDPESGRGPTVANIILLDAWAKRMEYPELKKAMVEEYEKWEPDTFVIEKKSSGSVLFQEMRYAGVPVSEFTPGKGQDKIARVNSVSDIFSSGLVWAPRARRWAQEVIEECSDFPSGANDDQVDAMTLAIRRFRTGGFIKLPSDEEDEETYGLRKRKYY